jgi:hypothetical protein
MQGEIHQLGYKDRSFLIRGFGLLLLLAGFAAAVFGPVEFYAFYLFSEGGRFHYPGFGFGSFMFGLIAVQIMGYYVIALICLPLGFGHLQVRRWVRKATLTLLWSWLILGIPLLVAFLVMWVASKDSTGILDFLMVPLLPATYLLIPGLLIWFYNSAGVRNTFETRDKREYWLDQLPIQILVLAFLFIVYLLGLHGLLFFNGIFPFLHVLLVNLAGFGLIAASVICLALLVWGTLGRKMWAWWGALLYFGILTVSIFISLPRYSLSSLLALTRFTDLEMQALQGLPIQGYHLLPIVGISLLLTIALIIYSRRFFGKPSTQS